jgi:hypothetical protein
MVKKLTAQDFLALHDFKLSETEIRNTTELVSRKNFNFEIASGHQRDEIILNTLSRIESNMSKSGEIRRPEWNDGWAENLNDFVSTNYDYSSLKPKYYRPGYIKRWQGDFIITESDSFEYDFFDVLRQLVFYSYLSSAEEVFEFGCGSPHNLVALSGLFHKVKLHGCDWSQSAVSIAELLREKKKVNIRGHLFDFFNPDLAELPKTDSIFLTCGGLEQVGTEFHAFVKFVLKSQPIRVIHLEPIYELYDVGPENLLDYLAKSYHSSRNYLKGYLTHIKELEANGLIEIETIRRIPFGGQFHEGWSLLIWRPIVKGLID